MQIRHADKNMQTSLHGIAKRAKVAPDHRFGNLFSLLNEENLHWCFPQLNKKSAPGVDAVSYSTFESNLDENIRGIVEDLMGNRYRAKLVRRKYIPKGGKQQHSQNQSAPLRQHGKRPLGIPAIGDKVLQKAVALILSAIYEEDFLPCSHGYRLGKGPQQAALELSKNLHRGRYGWVVDADIKGFFNNMDHDWLMKMLEQRINDKRFLGIIRKWLKAGILEEDGQVNYPVTGTPQGGIVSAVLANIYLHYTLDLWFEKVVKPHSRGEAMIMRFADDFVCAFQYHDDMKRFYSVLGKRLGKFKLELSPEKTSVIRFSRFQTEKESKLFTFLGFEYRWGLSRTGKPLVKMRTARMKLQTALANIRKWIRIERNKYGTAVIMKKLRLKLLGHWNYYGVSGNIRMLKVYYFQVCRIVFKWLNRRSQRKSCNWHGFNEMLKHFQIPEPRIVGYWS